MWLLLLACAKPDPALPPEDSPEADSPPPDSAPARVWYADVDGDGYGDPNAPVTPELGSPGFSRDATDCDDTRSDIHPGAVELCDEVDQDCDGLVDEEPEDGQTWYADLDQDGWGDPLNAVQSCDEVEGYIARRGDCDDLDPDTHGGAIDYCEDGVNQDCYGTDLACRPEGALTTTDADADLFGANPGDRLGADVQAHEGFEETGDATMLITAVGALTSAGELAGVAYLFADPTWANVDLDRHALRIEGDAEHPLLWTRFIGDINHDFIQDLFANGVGRGCILLGPVDGPRTLGAGETCSSPAFGDFADAVVLGDPNGGGRDDLVVSVSGLVTASDGQAHDLGRAYVFDGPGSSFSDLSLADGLLLPSESNEQGRFGDALCSGDFDADGVQDLAIGAPAGADGLPAWRAGGLVYLALGPLQGSLTLDDGQGQATGADGLWWGPTEHAQAGEALACRNDVDADGRDDVLVGATFGDAAPGAVFLLLDPIGSPRSLAEASWIVTGTEDLQGLGATLSLQSDLDHDGTADPIFSAFGPTDPTFLWYGGSLSGTTTTDAADAVFQGVGGSGIATPIAGGFDLDEDGCWDLLLGAPGAADLAGAAFVFYGGGAL